MNTIITSKIIQAYGECTLKSYFLLFGNMLNSENSYNNMLKEKAINSKEEYLTKVKSNSKVQPYSLIDFKKKESTLYDVNLKFKNLSINNEIIRLDADSNYMPLLIIGSNSITEENKIHLAFIGYILSKFQKKKTFDWNYCILQSQN